MASRRRYQVFVSSTYVDLTTERQKVLHALLELGCFPAGMEFFPADSDESWNYVAQVIDESDYYVLIIGGRYGSVSSGGLSFTERKYDYAVGKGRSILCFLHADPDSISVRQSDISPDVRAKLQVFRNKVQKAHLCKYWHNSDDLAGKVSRALSSAFQERPAAGWTRDTGSDIRPKSTAFDVIRHHETLSLTSDSMIDDLALRIHAAANGVEIFFRQITGTGGTRFESMECLSPSARILTPYIGTPDGWQKVFIHLGRQLAKGEETLVRLRETYRQLVWDEYNQHAYQCGHSLEHLKLELAYEASVAPSEAYWREYRGDAAMGEVVSGGRLSIDPEGGVLVYEVTAPRVGHAYSIDWMYDETTVKRLNGAD